MGRFHFKPSIGRKPDKTSELKRMRKTKLKRASQKKEENSSHKSEPEKFRNPIPESEPCFEKKMFERSEPEIIKIHFFKAN